MGIGLILFLALLVVFTHSHINGLQPAYIPVAVDIPQTYPEPEHIAEAFTEIIDIYVPGNTPYSEDIAEESPQNLKAIGRPMPLFANKYDNQYLTIIPPQTVEVLDKEGDWLLINTFIGPMWINHAFTPPVESLDNFFSRFGTNIGIYYKNLDTGFTYSFNPGRVFFGASINKITHGFYIYIAAERGYIDMYNIHTFRGSDFWGGSGIIRFMDVGTELTTRELLHHSIVHSDNIAFRMLARYMNNVSFTYLDFISEIGANPRFVLDNYIMSNTSAEDGKLWLYAIHNYLESESRFGHYFHTDLHNTAVYSHPYFTRGQVFGGSELINVQFIHSDYPVAQKFGWSCSAFNVAGIVSAPSPFILIIFSNMAGGAHKLFEEISWLMQGFNDMYFVGLAN